MTSFTSCFTVDILMATLETEWSPLTSSTGTSHKIEDTLKNNTVRLNHCAHFIDFHLSLFIQILTHLNLRNNQIRDKGAQYLAEALQNNIVRLSHSPHWTHFLSFLFMQVLTDLVLFENQITDNGVQYLAEALQKNTVRLNHFAHFIYFYLHFSYRPSLDSTSVAIKSKKKVHNIWLKHYKRTQSDSITLAISFIFISPFSYRYSLNSCSMTIASEMLVYYIWLKHCKTMQSD